MPPPRRSLRERVSSTFQIITELELTHAYERQAGTITIVVVVVAVATFALATGWRWGGSDESVPVRIDFPRAAGLTPGNPVNLRGVRIGRVEQVELTEPGHVAVLLSVPPEFAPRVDASAQIVPLNLVGSEAVEYVPGTNAEPLPAGQVLAGRPASSIGEQLAALRTGAGDLLAGLRGLDREALAVQWRAVRRALERAQATLPGLPADSIDRALQTALHTTDSLLMHVQRLAAAVPRDSLAAHGDSLRAHLGDLFGQVSDVQEALGRIRATLNRRTSDEGVGGDIRREIAALRHSLDLLQAKYLGRPARRDRADSAR